VTNSYSDKSRLRGLVYLWPEMFYQSPGLGHMKEIARTLFIEARLSDRRPILTPLFSNPELNEGRKGLLSWADFYDWHDIDHDTLQSRKPAALMRELEASDAEVWDESKLNLSPASSEAPLLIRVFPDSRIFGDWFSETERASVPEYVEPIFSNEYPKNIRELAAQVFAEIGPIDAAVHVRRGDLVGPEVHPDRVADYLRARAVPNDIRLLIMTNETNPAFADDMRRYYPNSVCEFEVPTLLRLRVTNRDNYTAFRVGSCIRAKFVSDLGSVRGPYRPPDPITNPVLRQWRRLRRRLLWLHLDQVQRIWHPRHPDQ
jgi:hypothetical protein